MQNELHIHIVLVGLRPYRWTIFLVVIPMKKHYKQIRQLSTVALFATGSRRYHSASKFSELPGAERLKGASRGLYKFRHLYTFLKVEV